MTLTIVDPTDRAHREIVDLARPLVNGLPQSPNHPVFRHTLVRRHGDYVRADGGSAANDLLVTGTHVGTHIDALAHVSHDGLLHGGHDAAAAQVGGSFKVHGVETITPILCRGHLLDIPRVLGVPRCEPGYDITPEVLDAALGDTTVEPGDVLLVRSGWGQLFEDGAAYLGSETGVPGVSEEGARWLAGHRPVAVGADSIAFERLAPGAGHSLLPGHRVLLVEHGIYIIESMDLERLSVTGVPSFLFVAVPLNIPGATGSPIRPLAIIEAGIND
jgi:kynurenine formamidase